MLREQIAKIGEEKALNYLLHKSHILIMRNFHCRQGEIDLITFEKNTRIIVFTEVKTRTSDTFGSPQESITRFKVRKILLAIYQFFKQHPRFRKYSWRIDAIALKLNTHGNLQSILHIPSLNL